MSVRSTDSPSDVEDSFGRIAYLVSRFPHFTETFIVREMVELEKRGHELALFSLQDHDQPMVQPDAAAFVDDGRFGNRLGVRRLIADQLTWLRRDPRMLLRVWASALWGNRASAGFLARSVAVVPVALSFALEMERDDVQWIHAHWATHPALAAWVINQAIDVPYSVTAHAHDLYVDQTFLAPKLEGAEVVVTISEFNRRFIGEAVESLETPIEVVHCGVDSQEFVPGPEPIASTPRGGPIRVLCVASLQEYKGHRYLLEAASLLMDRGVDAEFSLVGHGPLEKELQGQIAELGLEGNVRLLGPLPSPDVAALLAESDLFVLPSVIAENGQMEGLPVALMEALATETPVVATAISGIGELVQDGRTGRLVPPADGRAMSDAIADCAENPADAAAMARAGRRLVASDFDQQTNARAVAELIEGCLSDSAEHGTKVVSR